MDLSILLGAGGILVSIAVGWGTFTLTDRRARAGRWRHAKQVINQDLARTLGEGAVPSRDVVVATIRSVLRSQGTADMSAVTLEEIVDDLIRQVTADPFLDPERRRHLQDQLTELKRPVHAVAKIRPSETTPKRIKAQLLRLDRLWTWWAVLAGIMTTSLAAAAFVAVAPQIDDFLSRLIAEQPGQFSLTEAVTVAVALFTFALLAVWITQLYRHPRSKPEDNDEVRPNPRKAV